ncbi:hypothetical protein THRCLA_08991, partial [Thraustotheca clavata]
VMGNQLIIVSQPGTMTAGDVLSPPPLLQLVDDTGLVLTNVNQGFVGVAIDTNPLRYAVLSGTSGLSFPIVSGVITCTGLSIDLVASGYTLVFVSLTYGLQTTSNAFDIVLGPPYQLSMYTYIGVAQGGTPFSPQPTIAIVDKGGNIVNSVNSGTVSVAIANNPVGGILTPTIAYTVSFYQGFGKFYDLQIDKAGGPYTLKFTGDASLALPGGNTYTTFPFTVAIGPPSTMSITAYPLAAIGGSAFVTQPTIQLLDAGGNTLPSQPGMLIAATIYANPSMGTLYPSIETRVSVTNGIASFKNLRIDKAGNNYILRFAILMLNSLGTYLESGLDVVGPSFNVYIGPLFSLQVIQPPQSAIADGQPFYTQPILALKDRGNNTIITENLALVSVSMVPSLSLYNNLVVSTATSPTATIIDVLILSSPFTAPYGAGTDLFINITFSQQVLATGTIILQMNSANTAIATCNTLLTWSTTLTFGYGIAAGDAANPLNYASTAALVLQGVATIVDRLNNPASLTLPANGLRPNVVVDTTVPSIASVACQTPLVAGTYGPGQIINLLITFTAPVSVYGVQQPYLVLNTVPTQNAIYRAGNQTSSLVFQYTVGLTDTLLGATLDIATAINLNNALLRRTGTALKQDANLQMPTNAANQLPNQCAIIISSTAPTVDSTIGVISTTPYGNYATGDTIAMQISFTAPVTVSGIPLLAMNTGNNAAYVSGSGTNTLIFNYIVQSNDNVVLLDYLNTNSLVLNGGQIQRSVTAGTPLLDCNLDLTATSANGKNLGQTAAILLNGLTPTIVSISLPATPTTYTRGNTVPITVLFSFAVVVTGTPLMQLNTGGVAVYAAGSGSTALVFNYVVALGDSTTSLSYTTAFSLTLNKGSIKQLSSTPTLPANLALPWPINIINSPIAIDPNVNYVSTVVGIAVNQPAGEYGVNQVFQITVTFSDAVQVIGNAQLMLSTQTVSYASGSGSNKLVFLYVVQPNDATPSLNIASNTPFTCQAGSTCSIANANLVLVNLDCTGISIQPTNIVINTAVPTVVSVTALTPAPAINKNTFVVGDVIQILIVVSKQVNVEPSPQLFPTKVPILLLNTSPNSVAYFVGYNNNDRTQLLFQYSVQFGDTATNLQYANINALTLNYNQASIKRLSTSPTTNMNLVLPPVQNLGINLIVDTSRTPVVSSVAAVTPDGIYYVGDAIVIKIIFSEYVVVTGIPVLILNLGIYDQRAVYVSGSGSTMLLFQYTVAQDDFSSDLSYLDLKSLFVPPTASILFQSTNPAVAANCILPVPGQANALDTNSNIRIQGMTPYVIGINFLTANGTYTVGNTINVKVSFSTSVAVTGSPFLRMATGVSLRQAFYVPSPPDSSIVFSYVVQTGDVSSDLDYSDTASIQLNGGTIMTTPTLPTSTPIQQANINLNPPGGALTGSRTVQAVSGVVSYIDLDIDTMGLGYTFYFSTPPAVLTSVMFNVTYSAVWEVRNSPLSVLNRGDRTGSSVDINGNIAVVGSPGTKAQKYNVQVVTATGSSTKYVNEIQYVQTTCVQRDAIQVLTSSAAPGATIGGYFSLMYGSAGPTRRLQSDFDETQLKVAIQLDLGLLPSNLDISRTPNTYCGCYNAYSWTITFHIVGDVPTLQARNYLTGNGATIGDGLGGAFASVLASPPVVHGLFALRYGSLFTAQMPSNVDAATMTTRLTTDLSLPIFSVARSAPTAQAGYTWSITFYASAAMFNPNQLEPAPVLLSGNQVLLSVTTVQEGYAPLYGFFQLGLGNQATPSIPVTATANQMQTALLALSAVTSVAVVRSPTMNAYGGYSWTITFLEIKLMGVYGLVPNSLGTLPALTPITIANNAPILMGSNAEIQVTYAGINPSVNSAVSFGNSPGQNAGSVSVFVPKTLQWVQSALLLGTDTQMGDNFGASVSVSTDGTKVLVGAPYALYRGQKEVQVLSCSATGGTFTLTFLGITSPPIPFSATQAMLQVAIASLLNVPTTLIDVATYTNLCFGNNVAITLSTPDLGTASGDIPNLVPDGSLLTSTTNTAAITIQEFTQGTFRLDGNEAKGTTCGGAYFYQFSNGLWSQLSKMTPTGGSELEASEFGTSVCLETNFAIVGAPGALNTIGEAYVYNFNGVAWNLFQKLTIAPYTGTEGDRYGEVVKISGSVIAVSAPGYASNTGAVFVYQLVNNQFINFQKIQANDLQRGDRFGSALSIDMSASTLVIGTETQSQASGAAYVYVSPDMYFNFRQKLMGSDTRPNDGFGHSISLAKNILLVGANADFDSTTPLTIRTAVQSITTVASSAISGTFRIGFRKYAIKYLGDYIFTTPIPCDISAPTLQVTLQSQLNTGLLVVTRLGPDVNNGYTWYITFAGSTAIVPQFHVDGSNLVGKQARITSSMLVNVPPVVRSNVYIFTRTGSSWQEQATLRPTNKQYFSMFGHSVALSRSGYQAVVGASNADTLFTGINSGAAYVFDMGFLDFQFSASSYTVLEGNSAPISIQRCGALGLTCMMKSTTVAGYVDVDTGDAVTDMAGKNHVSDKELKFIGRFQELTMLDVTPTTPNAIFFPNLIGPEPYPQVPAGRYVIKSWIGTAQSRSQFYGSSEARSLWIDSQFDYQGQSDYTPTNLAMEFAPNSISKTINVQTTDDMVYEYPDETINVRLSVPGMWPSYPSQFWSKITILDNGDGGYGTTSYTALLQGDGQQTPSQLGKSVAMLDSYNLAAVGAPNKIDPISGFTCGAVYVYLATSGVWALEATLLPPMCQDNINFGTSVAIDGSYGNVRLVVGAPSGSIPTAFVFIRNNAATTWRLETRFTESLAVSSNTNYAGTHAVAISGYNIVIGASGLESVFVYTYATNGWQSAIVLRASDYAVDTIYLQNVVHVYQFGASISINRRAIVVGAPLANYGSNLVDDTAYLGSGAAYVYYLPAQVQQIKLNFDVLLTTGQFVLSLGGLSTNRLSFQISASDMATELQALIPSVQVVRTGTVDTSLTWTITIISEVTKVPLVVPTWKNYGCSTCLPFNSGYTPNPAGQIQVSNIATLGTWTFHQRLIPSDANHADRFGSSVSIDGDSIIVGAYSSSSLTTTTWNFETGDLTGWAQTGTAFSSQPTYGENVRARLNGYLKPYLKEPLGTLNFEGRYWVGTYELRPGAGQSQQTNPFSCAFMNDDCKTTLSTVPGANSAGTYQGDGPVGSLTSQPFFILGKSIRFRIGGGCNVLLVYVELLVDGISVLKNTGNCDERLRFVTWNVTQYAQRSGQIRIVDSTNSVNWGHINVDDFQFDWTVQQPATAFAGVAYVFYRSSSATVYNICQGIPKFQCIWMLQSRLVSSDKRAYDQFGFDVGINDATGVAVISAYGQNGVDLNNTIVNSSRTGSVYFYSRTAAVIDGVGNVITPPSWPGLETAKLQAVNKGTDGQFGYSISVSGVQVAIGSPGLNAGSGMAYVHNMQFLQVSFASQEVGFLEGTIGATVSIVLYRSGDTSLPLTIEYATSDISAIGVDSNRYTQCMAMPIQNRVNCGDYQQTFGVVTFPAGGTNLAIPVPIMNDWCYEPYAEYIAFHLNIPGGDVILGQQFTMKIRIDDDDFGRTTC